MERIIKKICHCEEGEIKEFNKLFPIHSRRSNPKFKGLIAAPYRARNDIICFIIIFISFFLFCPAKAEETFDLSSLITAQDVQYQDCIKVFNIDNVHLMYLTVAAINANRFKIDEIQSRSGFVLFTAVGKQFLASISNVNTNQGMLRITPIDDNYYFQPGIAANIFKYIELNLKTKLETIN